MSKIEVDRQKYVLMCIDVIKLPMEDHLLKEHAESELLRLLGEDNE